MTSVYYDTDKQIAYAEIEKIPLNALVEEKVIVIMRGDYADEFDLEGFVIMKASEWVECLKSLQQEKFPIEKYFGSNESVIYESFDDFMKRITVKIIGRQTELLLKSLLNMSEYRRDFGLIPIPNL